MESCEESAYLGREQALVKHELMGRYLERFMMILGRHCATVCYVDCFAGPWQSSTDDYSDTSFGRAVSILKGCREALKGHGRQANFRALFIEKDDKAFAKLDAYAKSVASEGVSIDVWHGDFSEKITAVANWIGSEYSFLLIDPLGYKNVIEPSALAPLLAKRNVEALINYMWKFLNLAVGHAGKPSHRENLLRLFGPEMDAVLGSKGLEKEQGLLKLYRAGLIKTSTPTGEGRTRTVSFPVEYPGTTANKYHLIHVTHSALGVLKFAEASAQATKAQDGMRDKVVSKKREDRTGVVDMFGDLGHARTKPRPKLQDVWMEQFPAVGGIVPIGIEKMALFIEQNDCLISDLQEALSELMKEGVLTNLDAKRARPKNVVHYEQNERIQRVR
jgi:three-Cys-motif partner protein